ncbi:hypothetical protein Tco_0321819 [Tanacetum coccineum]
MILRDIGWRYGTSKKKVNEVDFISQGVGLVSRKLATMTNKLIDEIQMSMRRRIEFVVVVVGLYDGGEGDSLPPKICCLEVFWEGGNDLGGVLRFHTYLTDILGFLEKLEWWFEQDIDEEEEDEEGEGGSEV